MKADFVFGLENAAWPALVLNDSGLIQRANAAAASAFGGVSEAGGASAASIWSPENQLGLEAFLTRTERASMEPIPVKLREKSGRTGPFLAYVSSFTKDGQRLHLVQLLRSSDPPSPGAAAGPSSATMPEPNTASRGEGSVLESSLAQKQKLECALQLTRTVALDFNNALTSILGHTSLILSKMEPNQPWRNSLVEVEKSAEKAAEVASDLAGFSRQEKDTHSQVAGNLNDLLRRTVELFQSPGSRVLNWALQLEPRLYTVSFEEAKMQQAFAKILDNAVQAVADQGKIVVRTRNQDIATPTQDGNVRLAAGSYVC